MRLTRPLKPGVSLPVASVPSVSLDCVPLYLSSQFQSNSVYVVVWARPRTRPKSILERRRTRVGAGWLLDGKGRDTEITDLRARASSDLSAYRVGWSLCSMRGHRQSRFARPFPLDRWRPTEATNNQREVLRSTNEASANEEDNRRSCLRFNH